MIGRRNIRHYTYNAAMTEGNGRKIGQRNARRSPGSKAQAPLNRLYPADHVSAVFQK